MAYGFNKPKTQPCPNGGDKGKHKWEFVRNGTHTTAGSAFGGSFMRVSLRGLYRCACGATRVGKPNLNAPDNDLRDHMNAPSA